MWAKRFALAGALKVLYPGGLSRDLNPGPLAPEARIIPLDQQAPPECRDAKKDSNGITPCSRTNGLWASLAQW